MTISDQIRKQLEQPDGLTHEALEPLAIQYGEETTRVNARLAECVQYLRKGLRSEAIQRAFMKPNLLDWSAQLDFPEIDDWIEILKFYGINVPPLLDRDSAQQLHEALVDEQPLDELLKQHRRLAIAKAPLAWRLKILRRLADLDALNPVWHEDQEQWEISRLKQIPHELTAAIEAKSLPMIQELSSELNQSKWVATIPSELSNRAAKYASQFLFESQSQQLQLIADSIHSAYSEANEPEVARQLQSWSTLVSTMESPPPEELALGIEPAMEWLREREAERLLVEKHERATDKLASALQKPKNTLEDLQRDYFNLISMQMGIDPLLDQRYQTRVAEILLVRKRRTQASVLAIVATTLVILAGGGFWYWQRSHNAAVESAVEQLSGFLDSDRLEEANRFAESLQAKSPAVAKVPKVVALVSNVKSRHDLETARAERAKKLIEEANAETVESLDIERIRAAEKEAKTPEELASIGQIRRRWEGLQEKLNDAHSTELMEKLVKIDERVGELRKSPIQSIKEAELDSLILDLKGLTTTYPRAGTQATNMVALSEQRVNGLRDSVKKQRKSQEQLLSSMKSLREATSVPTYENELKRIVDLQPNDPLVGEFKQVMQEAVLWKNIDIWNRWTISLGEKLEGNLTPDESSELSSTLETLSQGLNGNLTSAAEKELSAISTAHKQRSAVLEQVIEDLRSSVLLELLTILDSKKTRYFLNYQTRIEFAPAIQKLTRSSSLSIPVVSDGLGAVTQEKLGGLLTIYDEPRTIIRTSVDFIDKSRDVIIAEWEEEMIKLLSNIVKNEKLDKLLKEILISQIVDSACKGSEVFKSASIQLRQQLDTMSEKREIWFVENTFDFKVDEGLMNGLKATVSQVKKVKADQKAKLQSISEMRFFWAGPLLRSPNGEVVLMPTKEKNPDGNLFMIVPSALEPSNGRLEKIGKIVDAVVTIDASQDSLVAGRPVFLLRAKNTKK